MLWWSISDWRLKSFSSGIFSLLFLCLFFLSSILSLLCFLNAYQMNVGILGFSSMFLKLYFCIFNLIGFFPSFPLPPSLPFLFFLCLFLSVSFFCDLLWDLSSSKIFLLIFSHFIIQPFCSIYYFGNQVFSVKELFVVLWMPILMCPLSSHN